MQVKLHTAEFTRQVGDINSLLLIATDALGVRGE